MTRDVAINGVRLYKGEFVCIIPDALQFSSNESIVSSVIGAPNRPCMGMHVSSKTVDAYEKFFSTRSEIISTWNICSKLSPSLSALQFAELVITKDARIAKHVSSDILMITFA